MESHCCCILQKIKKLFSRVSQGNDAHITEGQLLEQWYATRNNHILGALLQRYTLLLLGVCMKYLKNEEEAKDAVQQVFVKAILELQKYKVDYLKSWLYMIARNHCLMKLRDKRMIIKEADEWLNEEADEPAFGSMNKETILLYLEEAVAQLNAEQKTCVTLFYLHRKSYSEISAATGLSLQHIKSCIQNGKRNLKLFINKKMQQHNG